MSLTSVSQPHTLCVGWCASERHLLEKKRANLCTSVRFFGLGIQKEKAIYKDKEGGGNSDHPPISALASVRKERYFVS